MKSFRGMVLAMAVGLVPAASQAGVFVSVGIAPPAIPVYVQPVCPEPGFLWTPGYWAYGPDGYFWVPGVWVRPPQVGLLWTPGYWGWRGGVYAWNAGYWGPHVGFYGGVNYGFGYGGVGFVGGRWAGGVFAYNSAVMHVGVGATFNTYHETVVLNNVHTSYNGGTGGLTARASASERSAMNEHHIEPTTAQTAHHEAASHDRSQLASVNHGTPANAAMSKPRAAAANTNHAGPGTNHSAANAQKSGGGINKPMASASKPQSKGNGGGNKGGGKPAGHASGGKGKK
jgi:hypothetical protein